MSRRADLALSNGKLYLIGDSSAFLPGTFTWLPQAIVFLVNPPAPEPMVSFAGLFSHGLLNIFKSSVLSHALKLPVKSFAVSNAIKALAPVKAGSASNKAPDILKLNTNLNTHLLLGGSGALSTLELPPIAIDIFGRQVAAVEVNEIYLQGTSTNLKAGDRMLLVGTNSATGGMATQAFIVRGIDVQSSLNRTLVEFTDGPATPSFTPSSFPPEIVKEEKIPFSHSAVRTHILEKTIGEGDLADIPANEWLEGKRPGEHGQQSPG